MKTQLLLLFCLLCSIACVKKQKEWFQPDIKPNYRVVLEFDLSTSADKQAMLDSAKNVTKRRLDDVFYYSNLTTDLAQQTLTIDLIGMDLSAAAIPDTMLNTMIAARTMEGRLEFFNTYRNIDEGILPALTKSPVQDSLLGFSINMNPGSVIGYSRPENTSRVEAGLLKAIANGQLPADLSSAWSLRPVDLGNASLYELYFLKGDAPLTGVSITKAEVMPSQDDQHEPSIALTFNASGTQKWAEMTTKAYQNGNREIAIVFNGRVLTAPVVVNPITSGKSTLASAFSIPQAISLAHIFQSGQLPVAAKVVSAKKLK